ncbi:potassium channel family protein [Faecalibaculum rodentium]|uniref:potassium channel family protein n=1 Tax=Faecalibaculum rodentium TaxID=1702221 RepID=UPI002631C6A4|nr:potassium channel family protein [Faecalibaculum rodentium]
MIRSLQLFWLILERLHLKKFLFVFLLWYVIACILLWILDPGITTLADGFWFGFILVTTIGFGDFTVTTLPARIVAGILGLYGDLVITFLTGSITSWFFEKFQAFRGHSVGAFVTQLEHMDELSDEELQQVADKAKALRAQKEAGKQTSA